MRLVGSGERLKRRMEQLDLTPRTLAEQAGTNKDTIYRLIGGQQRHCNGDVGARIERALGFKPGGLFRVAKRPRRPNGVRTDDVAA